MKGNNMKKHLSFAFAVILFFSITFISEASVVPSIDDLLSASPQNDKNNSYLYDNFIDNFSFYCNAWGASWNTKNISTISNDGNVLVSNIDGLILTIDIADNTHPVTDAAVYMGSGEIDYKTTVMLISLVATIEHDRPGTKSERLALLKQISPKIEGAMSSLSLLLYNPKDGDSFTAMVNGPNAIYDWRYFNGNIYLGIAL